MANVVCCRCCVVEMEPIGLADGTAALVCVACDVIGLEHEVVGGGPMWSAGLAAQAPVKKFRRLTVIPSRARSAYAR